MCVPFLGDHIVCIVVVSWVLCLLRQVAGCAMGELDTWFNGGDGGVGSAIMSLFTCFTFSSASPLGNAVPKFPLVHCHLLVGSRIVHLHFLFL